MSVRRALGAAGRDLYANSWRLLAVNATLSAVVLALGALAAFVPPAVVLLPLGGPFVAALAHCAVLIAREGEAHVRDALHGLRVHARRALWTGAAATVVLALAEHAARFYAAHHTWVLAALVVYLLALFVLQQLFLWTLLVAAPQRPLRELWAAAAFEVLRRPGQALALALALLVLEGLATVAGVLPLLTLGVAYAFLAAAHLVLPQPAPEEEAAWQA